MWRDSVTSPSRCKNHSVDPTLNQHCFTPCQELFCLEPYQAHVFRLCWNCKVLLQSKISGRLCSGHGPSQVPINNAVTVEAIKAVIFSQSMKINQQAYNPSVAALDGKPVIILFIAIVVAVAVALALAIVIVIVIITCN